MTNTKIRYTDKLTSVIAKMKKHNHTRLLTSNTIAYPSLMPSPPIWLSFLLWLIAASAMLLMMLPGSAIVRHIILLFIAAIATVLAYCGYLTVVVKAAAIANLSCTVYH